MPLSNFTTSLLVLSLLPILPAGCGVWRGIPSHGGGKRFDEEQRVVAGSIRQTLADMDFSELAGRKVQLAVECISQDGGATVSFPGISSLNAGLSGSFGTGNLVQINQTLPVGPAVTNDNDNTNVGGSVGMGYNAQTCYSPTVMSTMPDLGYFHAALDMKCRHAGVMLVNSDPDIILYVLVDVLGTNRSRAEDLLSSTDTLEASCECTYYAQDARTGRLVFGARQASSAAVYRETHHLAVKGPAIERTLTRTVPTSLPVDDARKPSTQPVIARKKPWLEDVFSRMAGLDY